MDETNDKVTAPSSAEPEPPGGTMRECPTPPGLPRPRMLHPAWRGKEPPKNPGQR